MSLSIELEIRPSFQPTSSYRLDTVRGDDDELVYRVVRNKAPGLFPSYGDETVETTWDVTGPAAQEIERRLRALTVTVCPDYELGLDGTFATLKIMAGANRVEFHWWPGLPQQWAELWEIIKVLDPPQDPIAWPFHPIVWPSP